MRAFALVVGAAVAMATPAQAGEIAPYERGTFAKLRAEHSQRPLVVHFWSTTCLPCLHEMPHLAAFSREHPDLAMIFVAAESIAGTPRIASRLEKFGLADSPNYAFADAFEERLRFEVDRRWRGELPFTVLVRPGRETTAVSGELEPGRLTEWLRD